MKKTSFIFDLDGTLVHTLPEYRYSIVGQTLKDLGVLPQNNLIDRFWFEARRDEIVTQNFGLTLEAFWKLYRKYDTVELRKKLTKLYDDIDFIHELKKAGCKIAIVTGAPVHIAELEINMLGKNNFDAIVIAHRMNGFIPKPDPHGLNECLKLLNVQKDQAVYIGNADEDVEIAKNAQILDVLLDRGEHKFPKMNPSLTIHSLYELRQLI